MEAEEDLVICEERPHRGWFAWEFAKPFLMLFMFRMVLAGILYANVAFFILRGLRDLIWFGPLMFTIFSYLDRCFDIVLLNAD